MLHPTQKLTHFRKWHKQQMDCLGRQLASTICSSTKAKPRLLTSSGSFFRMSLVHKSVIICIWGELVVPEGVFASCMNSPALSSVNFHILNSQKIVVRKNYLGTGIVNWQKLQIRYCNASDTFVCIGPFKKKKTEMQVCLESLVGLKVTK